MTDEWGPWQTHDGKGCPVQVGTWVRGVDRIGIDETWRVGFYGGQYCWDEGWNCWLWQSHPRPVDIIRYRIRKPRALLQLIDMVTNLPVRESEDA